LEAFFTMLTPPRTSHWFLRLPLACAAVFIVLQFDFIDQGCPRLRADAPPDTVEKFRQFLRTDLRGLGVLLSLKGSKTSDTADIDERIKKKKAECADKFKQLSAELNSVSKIVSVLQLREWDTNDTQLTWGGNDPYRREEDPEKKPPLANIPGDLGTKLAESMSAIQNSKDPVQQRAMCALLGDTGNEAWNYRFVTASKEKLSARPLASVVLLSVRPKLVSLVEAGDRDVRAAATMALACVDVEARAKTRVDAVRKLLERDRDNVGSRRIAYLALAQPFAVVRLRALYARDILVIPTGTNEAISEERQTLLSEGNQAILSLPLLKDGVTDPDVQARLSAVEIWRDIAALLQEEIKPPIPGRANPPEVVRAYQAKIASLSKVMDAIKVNHDALLVAAVDSNREVRLLALAAASDLAKVQNAVDEWSKSTDKPVKPLPELSDKEGRRLIEAVEKNLSSPDPDVRLAAITVLDDLGQEAGAPATKTAVKALRDNDAFVRWAAIRILGRFAPGNAKEVMPALVAGIGTPDGDVARALASLLTKYGIDAAPAVPALTKAIFVGEPEARIAYLQTLPSVGAAGADAVPAIRQLLRPDPKGGRIAPSRYPPAFAPGGPPKYDDPAVRAAAAQALGRFGKLAAQAEPELRQALNDEDAAVRRAASEALLRIREK
jgi:HEAT repeat protein